jgi:hypothetical protein
MFTLHMCNKYWSADNPFYLLMKARFFRKHSPNNVPAIFIYTHLGMPVRFAKSLLYLVHTPINQIFKANMDTLFTTADRALRTIFAHHHASRANPANGIADAPLNDAEKREASALLHINYIGEVCAQALYTAHPGVMPALAHRV